MVRNVYGSVIQELHAQKELHFKRMKCFDMLNAVEKKLEMLATGNYSKNIEEVLKEEIEKLRPNLTMDVFELISKK